MTDMELETLVERHADLGAKLTFCAGQLNLMKSQLRDLEVRRKRTKSMLAKFTIRKKTQCTHRVQLMYEAYMRAKDREVGRLEQLIVDRRMKLQEAQRVKSLSAQTPPSTSQTPPSTSPTPPSTSQDAPSTSQDPPSTSQDPPSTSQAPPTSSGTNQAVVTDMFSVAPGVSPAEAQASISRGNPKRSAKGKQRKQIVTRSMRKR